MFNVVIHTLNGIALCAGAGGLELGLHIAEPGYKTVCYVEREAHGAATLVARMEDKALDKAPVWDDVKTFRGKPWRGKVDILTAGYPCQPFSSAGKKLGTKDPRHIWPDIGKIIKAVDPQAVFLENVSNHLHVGFPVVANDLQKLGFRVMAGLFTAREVGARQIRRRLFILADADRGQRRRHTGSRDLGHDDALCQLDQQKPDRPGGRGRKLDVVGELDDQSGWPESLQGTGQEGPLFAPGPLDFKSWYQVLRADTGFKPALRRDAARMAGRLERQRLTGNGVCPLAAAFAYSTLRAAFAEQAATGA